MAQVVIDMIVWMQQYGYLAAAAAAVWAVLATAALLRRQRPRTGREYRTEYAAPDFGDAAGFRLVDWPDDEICIPHRFWLVEDSIAEIDYLITPGKFLTLRVAESGKLRPPRGYEAAVYEREAQYEIDGVTVTQRQSPGRRSTAEWERDGFAFMICSDEPEMNMISGLAYTFVTTVKAEAT